MTTMSIRLTESAPVDGRATADVQAAFERCAGSLGRYFAVRVRDDHLAEDLVQQVWVRARLGADRVQADNAEPWLWRIAQNVLREDRRRRGRQSVVIGLDAACAAQLAEQFDTMDLPDELLARDEVRQHLLLALTALPAESQELLISFYFHGCTHAHLAQQAAVSERAIEGRLYRARAALRERLGRLDEEWNHAD